MKKIELPNDLEVKENKTPHICLSIITPVPGLSKDREMAQVQIEKTIQQAKLLLRQNYDDKIVTYLSNAIDELFYQIDYMCKAAGIGLFVSDQIKALIHFNFPVTEKVTIDHAFCVTDLLYESYYDVPYIVLVLGKKEARLYNARLNNVTEITNHDFPQKREASYEYSRPARGSSYVGHSFVKEFEKDKSIMEEIRVRDFFRETDKLLKNYITRGCPLVITGDNKEVSCYKSITAYDKQIAGAIRGSYISSTGQKIGIMAWEIMQQYLNDCKLQVINDFKRNIDKGPGSVGIENIWRAVLEGRCCKLLVEKDYSVKGYIPENNEFDLHLKVPDQPHRIVYDVVNDLILTALDKKAEVIIFEKNMLKDYEKLGVITR